MPFINYEIGDQVEINEKENINESFNGDIINKVIGRNEDIIKLNNGNILTNPGLTIIFKDLPIRSYKVLQCTGDKIICGIVKDKNFNLDSEELIVETLKLYVGKNVEVSIKYYDNEVFTNSGKNTFYIVS